MTSCFSAIEGVPANAEAECSMSYGLTVEVDDDVVLLRNRGGSSKC
jgi:hypothetical protein